MEQALNEVDAALQLNTSSGQLVARYPPDEENFEQDTLASRLIGLQQLAKTLRIGALKSVVVAKDNEYSTSSYIGDTVVTVTAQTLDRAQLATNIAEQALDASS